MRYRGIFVNDEAPALTGWVLEKFGKYGVEFYAKVFELLLRLKVGSRSVSYSNWEMGSLLTRVGELHVACNVAWVPKSRSRVLLGR